jgi:hypothetical protein
MRPHLATLAGLAQEALADEGKMKELPPKVTSLLEKIEDPKEKCQIAYLAGKVLKLHGQEAAAKELFTQAAGVPFTHHAATLSAIELR